MVLKVAVLPILEVDNLPAKKKIESSGEAVRVRFCSGTTGTTVLDLAVCWASWSKSVARAGYNTAKNKTAQINTPARIIRCITTAAPPTRKRSSSNRLDQNAGNRIGDCLRGFARRLFGPSRVNSGYGDKSGQC